MVGAGPVSLAVIGAGDFGSRYVNTIATSSYMTLAGVADCDRVRQNNIAKELGVPTAPDLSSLLTMLPDGAIDGVVIATPPTAHISDLRLLVERGIPVLVEKPVVADEEGLTFLHSLTNLQKSLVLPAHLSRHLDQVRFLRNLAARERVILINAWRYVPKERVALHGADHPALSAMIHDLDLVRAVINADVTSLHVTSKKSSSSLVHPDTVIATFTLSNDALVTVGTSWTLPNSSRYVEATFEVVTTEQKFVVRTPSNGLIVQSSSGNFYPAAELGLYEQGGLGGAFVTQLRHFVDVLSLGTQPEVSVSDAEWSIRLALDIANWKS